MRTMPSTPKSERSLMTTLRGVWNVAKRFPRLQTARVEDDAELALRFPSSDHKKRGNLFKQFPYGNLKSGRLLAAAAMLFVASGSLLIYWVSRPNRANQVQRPEGQVVQRMTEPAPSVPATPVTREIINSQTRPRSSTRPDPNLKTTFLRRRIQVSYRRHPAWQAFRRLTGHTWRACCCQGSRETHESRNIGERWWSS